MAATAEEIAALVRASKVIASDEACVCARFKGKSWWPWGPYDLDGPSIS